MSEREQDEQFENIKINTVPHGTEPAAERCAEMLLRAMRSTSKTASRSYLSAAQWFALAASEKKS